MEEEKENQSADAKDKSPQMSANKKVKNEPPKKKKEDKKAKGIHGFSIQSPVRFLGSVRFNLESQASVSWSVSWQIVLHANPA